MEWRLDPVIFEVFGRGIRYYGVLFALGIFIGYLVWMRQMKRLGHSEETAEKFVTMGFIAILLGARLGHCLFYQPEIYLTDPIRILFIWEGGLASHGATIALILALYLYHRWNNIHFLDVLDCLTIPAAVSGITIRIGNFLNSEIVGRVADVPWAVRFMRHFPDGVPRPRDVEFNLNALPRHPSQLYEATMGLIVLLTLYFVDRHYYDKKRPKGLLIGIFLALYFTGRFIVEYFKEFQVEKLVGSHFTMGQLLSIPFVVVGYTLLYRVFTSKPEEPVVEKGSGDADKQKKGKKKGKKKKAKKPKKE